MDRGCRDSAPARASFPRPRRRAWSSDAALPSPVGLLGRIRGHAYCVVEVTGLKGDARTRIRMWSGMSYDEAYRRHGTNATAYMVGTGGAAATEVLLDGGVRGRGLVVPGPLPPDPLPR